MTEYEIWNLVISGIAAFFTALAIIWILFKETILSRWKAPKLQSLIHMDMPYVTKQGETYYYHLGVKNIGRSTAQNCRGYVDRIYEYNNGQYERVKNFIAMPLFWAREEKPDTFIGPDQEKFLDIGTINTNFIYLGGKRPFIFWFRAFSDTGSLYLGRYKVKIILYSENTKSLSVDLYINWSGQGKEKYEDMLKELIISDKINI